MALLGMVLLAGCAAPDTSAAGIVVEIDSAALGDVRGFTLRTDDGRLLPFAVGRLEFDVGAFPATHLREHMATAEHIAVAYRIEGERRVAYRITDAPWAAP